MNNENHVVETIELKQKNVIAEIIPKTQKLGLVARAAERLKEIARKLTGNKIIKKLKYGIAALAMVPAMLFSACQPSNTPPDGNDTGLFEHLLSNTQYSTLLETAQRSGDYSSLRKYSNPLDFLQGEGYNVNSIKSGDVECTTTTYTLKDEANSLYVRTSIQLENSDIYTQYLIKYTLTKQEMKEYKELHTKRYIQACFAISLLSELKIENILSKASITKQALVGIQKSFGEKTPLLAKELLGSDNIEMMLTEYSVKDRTATFYIYTASKSANMHLPNRKMGKVTIYGVDRVSENNGAYTGPYSYGPFFILDDEEVIYRNSIKDIDYYTLVGSTLNEYVPHLSPNKI